MKKILSISIILIFIICLGTCSYGKSTCKVNLNISKTTMSKNEEFVVETVMSNIQSENGIIAIGGVLEYDKNSLELVKMEGENGWANPSYNKTNGKLVTDKNATAKKDEAIFKITFKVKEQAQKNVTISLKDIAVADGEEETKIENEVIIFTVKDGTNNTNTNINTNTNSNAAIIENKNISNQDSTTIVSGVLPKTGVNNIGTVVTLIIAILSVGFFYIKLKIINRKI